LKKNVQHIRCNTHTYYISVVYEKLFLGIYTIPNDRQGSSTIYFVEYGLFVDKINNIF